MSNQPAHKIKLGLITATIWDNDGSYSVDMARSYKTDEKVFKNTLKAFRRVFIGLECLPKVFTFKGH